jgi:excinuclease ABC subunit A
LYPELARALHNVQTGPGPYRLIEGPDLVHKGINITLDPIDPPRSNPATYVGVFTAIRSLFASLPEAKTRGYKAGRFSFNAHGGRCDTCR